MRLLLLVPVGLLLAAEPPAEKPDYLKKQPRAGAAAVKVKPVPAPPKPQPGETAEPALPAVTEMSVKSSSQGVSAAQGKSKKAQAVHGEVIAGSGTGGRGATGTAVIQDTKRGKWAVTTSTGKATTTPR